MPWVKKIASEAQHRHKTLIAFSHYPLIEFNDGASETISKAWGDNKFDLSRVAEPSVSKVFLQAGTQLHFAEHMHINNTATISDEQGNKLYNIQVPSIATYSPTYKIATVKIVSVDGLKLFEQVTGYSPSQDSTSWKSRNL